MPSLQGSNKRISASGGALEQRPAGPCHTQYLTVPRWTFRASLVLWSITIALDRNTPATVHGAAVSMSSASCQTTRVRLDARCQSIA